MCVKSETGKGLGRVSILLSLQTSRGAYRHLLHSTRRAHGPWARGKEHVTRRHSGALNCSLQLQSPRACRCHLHMQKNDPEIRTLGTTSSCPTGRNLPSTLGFFSGERAGPPFSCLPRDFSHKRSELGCRRPHSEDLDLRQQKHKVFTENCFPIESIL